MKILDQSSSFDLLRDRLEQPSHPINVRKSSVCPVGTTSHWLRSTEQSANASPTDRIVSADAFHDTFTASWEASCIDSQKGKVSPNACQKKMLSFFSSFKKILNENI